MKKPLALAGLFAAGLLAAVGLSADRSGSAPPGARTVTVTVPCPTTTTTTTAPTTTPLPPGTGLFGIASGYGPINATDADLARELDGYVSIGASTIRIDFPWDRTETAQDVFDWSIIDRIVSAARARNLDVIGTLLWTPAWARSGGSGTTPPTNDADYADFARRVVERYAPQGVKVFELWNEPNIPAFFNPVNVSKYAAMVTVAYAAMKAADSTITVLAGATAPVGGYNDANCDGVTDSGTRSDGGVNPVNFLQQALAAGITFDGWSDHPYEYGGFVDHPCSAWKQMSETPVNLVGLLNGKPLWVTEYGNPVSVSETEQASRLTQAFDFWKNATFPRGRFMYFNYRDNGEGFGLVRPDWTQRPAWAAYQAYPKS